MNTRAFARGDFARGNWMVSARRGYLDLVLDLMGEDEAPKPTYYDALAKVGHKLNGKDGGLSCISCHGVNAQPAAEVFESEGINLGHTAARLQRSYFFRWMRLPAGVDPQTKMPAFWDDSGKSPLTEILDGDAEKQINAVWHYLWLGEKMPKPVVPE